jgi:Bacterial capsule synthesis protein PGA_cap
VSRPVRFLLAAVALAGCATQPEPAPPAPVPADTARPAPRAVPPAPVPRPPPAPKPRLFAPVRLAFTGDINLGTLTIPDGVPPDSGRGLFDGALSSLTGDLVVGNFEGVLGDSGTTYKCGRQGTHVSAAMHEAASRRPPVPEKPRRRRTKEAPRTCYAFLTPTALAPRLREAGFTHLNLANNHANDFGAGARRTTEAIFDSLGLRHYGPLGNIALDSVRRGDSVTAVALVGFTTYPYAYDLLDVARSAAVVDSVRRLADLVIVTFHGGAEGVKALNVPEAAESLGREPRGDLRLWARAVIDAGADAVVGHGPHVLRGIEFYRGRPIVYSLGNFLTYRGFNISGPLGVTGVLHLEFGPDRRLSGARLVPMVQRPRTGPVPDPASEALDLVRRLSAEDFGDAAARVDPGGVITGPP